MSYTDDNFGDTLIRITFQALLEVALANHGVNANAFEIVSMPLKDDAQPLDDDAAIVFFAGGGLFGLSYLGFYPHVDRITAAAQERGVPVVFSSMGLNNMASADGDVQAIADILNRSCVRGLSVRENHELFERAAIDSGVEVIPVADPAVWTKQVFGMTDAAPDRTWGINVVRGGLFRANDRAWGLTAEMDYVSGLRALCRDAGISSQLFTNGSVDDNTTLRYYTRAESVRSQDVRLPVTTREVVEAIATRSRVAAIRMHSAIIAYSFGVPTVALQWNDKVAHFYEAIGHPERAIPFGEWRAERAFELLRDAQPDGDSDHYREYLMTTYNYIFDAVREHLITASEEVAPFSFGAVSLALESRASQIDETEFELRLKVEKAERASLRRFIALRESESTVRTLRARLREYERRTDDTGAQLSE